MSYKHEADYYADQYFSRLYDSPEERAERNRPKEYEGDDDDFDTLRDQRHLQYDPKDWQWGSWDK